MSLDVYLESTEPVQRRCHHCDNIHTVVGEELYEANITHNLTAMADAAGIYGALWRPEEIGATKAGDIVPILRDGLARLEAEPETFRIYNPSNGWGDYDGLVRFVRNYLNACEQWPDATIKVSR